MSFEQDGGIMQVIQFIRRASLMLFAAPAIAFMSGCDEIDQMNQNAAKRPPIGSNEIIDAAGNAPSTPAPAPAATPNTGGQAVSSEPAPQPAAMPPATTTPTTPTLEKAAAGQGIQGQGYGGGIVTEPIHQYFMARDRIKIAQLQHQLDIWKALHNNKPPKNKDEYIKEIVEPCGVELPDLPPGRRYVYDAKKGELLVESGGPAQ
jgi:hypothetical protein